MSISVPQSQTGLLGYGPVASTNTDSSLNTIALNTVCEYGYWDIVKIFLADERIKYSVQKGSSLSVASMHGHSEIVKLLFKGVDCSMQAFDALCNAEDKRVDQSANHSKSLYLTSQNGHLEIVKLLLNQKSFHLQDCNGQALYDARKNGHHEIFTLLLLQFSNPFKKRTDSGFVVLSEWQTSVLKNLSLSK
ncbi:hypothetical protein HK100_006913 [Physocladia obscura]|uniref:Ankyrin repeat protein n=1 Tax=Physocladia obscura TaxID=109957 RepID=A0AAD5XBF8_9FUNG|nr:hypothetical protein HK100_006913 [Physocladia obscura]